MNLSFKIFSQILLHLCVLIYIVSQNTQLRENLDENVLPAMANLFYWTGFAFALKDGSKRDVGIFSGITVCILVIAHWIVK